MYVLQLCTTMYNYNKTKGISRDQTTQLNVNKWDWEDKIFRFKIQCHPSSQDPLTTLVLSAEFILVAKSSYVSTWIKELVKGLSPRKLQNTHTRIHCSRDQQNLPLPLMVTVGSARGPVGRKGAQKSIVAGERRRSASHAHELKAALGWLVLIYPRASVFPVLLFRRQGFRSIPAAARLYRAALVLTNYGFLHQSFPPMALLPIVIIPREHGLTNALFSSVIPGSQSSRRTSRRAGH